MSAKAKGTRAEHRCMRALEAGGYLTTRAAASLGVFDIVAVGADDVRLIQVKYGTSRLSRRERDEIAALALPDNVRAEYWLYRRHARAPIIEILPTVNVALHTVQQFPFPETQNEPVN